MSKYKDNFDRLANSIYNKLIASAQEDNKLMEMVQQAPSMQTQQPGVVAAQPQQVDPNAMTSSGQMAGVQASQPAADNGQGEEVTDEVGMSEIQEMAGQLAQMIRDFKETNPDEFVEAAKFAAGMVISAAIKGLKYRDRKDILKKVKAGEFNQDGGDESSVEEQPVEQQPEGQEGMVAERLRKDNSRETDDDRKGLNPKEKKNIRSKKSPFSGVNEDDENGGIETHIVDQNFTASDGDKYSQEAKANGSKGINYVTPNGEKTVTVTNTIDLAQQINNKNNAYYPLAETLKLTKRQLDMIRLSETKTKFVKFSKKQLDEIMKK